MTMPESIFNIQFSTIIIFSLSQVYGYILHLSFIQGDSIYIRDYIPAYPIAARYILRFIHISIHYWRDYIFPISIRRYRVSTKMFMQFFWICAMLPASRVTASTFSSPVFGTSEYTSDTSSDTLFTSSFSSSLVIFCILGSPYILAYYERTTIISCPFYMYF